MFREVRETKKNLYETASSDFDLDKRIDTSKYNDFSRPEEREVEKHFDPDERAIPSGRAATTYLIKNIETDSMGRVVKFEMNLENPDGLNSGDLNMILKEAEKLIVRSKTTDEDKSKGWVNLPFRK